MDKPVDIPELFLDRMQAEPGLDFDSFRTALGHPGPVSIRWNPMKSPELADSMYDSEPVSWCRYGRYLSQRPAFPQEPLWHAGAFYVQEASSMYLEQVIGQLDLPADTLALDACAAPGGKATHLLSLLGPRALVVANEVVPKRNLVLQENLLKWGFPNVAITQAPAAALSRLERRFDLVLTDAPCSGEGLFRRDYGARRDWSPGHVAACALRQSHLLDSLAPTVRPGGYLLYATCTWSREENENQMERLLTSGLWDLQPLAVTGHPGIEAGSGGIGLRFYPHRVAGEGLFLACLRKRGNVERVPTPIGPVSEPLVPRELGAMADLEGLRFVENRGKGTLFPRAWNETARLLSQQLPVTRLGTEAGQVVHGKFNPAHDLALSIRLRSSAPGLELSLEDARTYLRKGPVAAPAGADPGWYAVRYQGMALGWAKVLRGRVNNYYPKFLSIRP